MIRYPRLGAHLLSGDPEHVRSLPVGSFCFGVPVDQPLDEDRIRRLLTPYLEPDADGMTWLTPICILNSSGPVSEGTLRPFIELLASFPHPASPTMGGVQRFIVGNEPGSVGFFADLAAYPDYYRLAERVIEALIPTAIVSPAGIADGALRGTLAQDPRAVEAYETVASLAGQVITLHHHSEPADLLRLWPLRRDRLVWLTEAGYPEPRSVGAVGDVARLEDLQRAGAADYLRLALGLPGSLLVCWSPVQDSGRGDRWDGVGLYRTDGGRKPGWDALAQVAAESPGMAL